MGFTVSITVMAHKENLLNDFIRLVNMLACLKCILVDGYTVWLLSLCKRMSLIWLMASVKCQFLASYMTRSLSV